MLFSPPCEYGIRALTYLSGVEPGKPVAVSNIAEETDIPQQFLSKILLTLKKNQILKSSKGPGGGYYLAKNPDAITLRDVASALDTNRETTTKCVLGLDLCRDDHPCPLHVEWKMFRAEVDAKINTLSIQQLYVKLQEKRAHLKA